MARTWVDQDLELDQGKLGSGIEPVTGPAPGPTQANQDLDQLGSGPTRARTTDRTRILSVVLYLM